MILSIFSTLQGSRIILQLIFSLNHDDNMPLSLKYIASTSDVIFIWHTSATVSSGPTYKVCVWKKLKDKRERFVGLGVINLT